MKRTKVTFFIDASDPDDSTGLTEEAYDELMEFLMSQFGADDITIELVNE